MSQERKLLYILNIVLGLVVIMMRDIVLEPITLTTGLAMTGFALWNLIRVKS